MRRLRIVQQIIIVILFAIIIPFVTIGFIISNVSQQSVRRELNYGVAQVAKYTAESIQRYIENSNNEFSLIALALEELKTPHLKQGYLKQIEPKVQKFVNLKIAQPDSKAKSDFPFDYEKNAIELQAPLNNQKILTGELPIDGLKEIININEDLTQYIFVFDKNLNLIAANNDNSSELEGVKKVIPKKRVKNKGKLFSKIKNQPLAYYEITNPDWVVVAMTHPMVTKNTIDRARGKIIACLLIAAFCILLTVGLYTYYLYINIRQLFKGITAISKGSYDRKIRLLKSIFTPHEVVFLEKEFNYMTQKVSQAYKEISEKNLELKRLNEYRDSLVSAISHEFRTPLTGIIGYSSRLMRQDIVLDEETKNKSLHIIKQQAQRLSRMVDDLLTIPDIESFHLLINPDMVDLLKVTELCIEYSNTKNVSFELSAENNLKKVYADYDRLIQIVINLCDNAVKYNIGEEPVLINIKNTKNGVRFTISNKSEEIPKEMLNKLYEKFVRLDSDLTRTTRGTGLGLFIVKGLSNAMNIKVSIENIDNMFSVNLDFRDKEVEYESDL